MCIAPGEGENSLVADDNCELLAFPYLFSKRKFGCNIQVDIRLIPIKYFNQHLNYTKLFASKAGYIFYVLSVSKQLKLNSQVNPAMKKVCGWWLTAQMLSNNFTEIVRSF